MFGPSQDSSVWLISLPKCLWCGERTENIWSPAKCTCENEKYLGSIIQDSVTTCAEIIEGTKTIPEKTVPTKNALTNFYILLTFLLITIA